MREVFARLVLISFLFSVGCSDSNNDQPPVAELLDRYELSSTDSIPEGIAFDPVDRVFYATSLEGGSITRIAADGSESIFRAADGRARLAGVKVDVAGRQLWVCARNVDGVDDRIWVFDLDSGEVVREYLLGALVSSGACNDLVLDGAGFAYVTDPDNPYIYRLDPQTGEGSIFSTDPRFEDVTGLGVGLNGLVISPDETALIVAKSLPSQLFRISLSDGSAVTPISLTGDPLVSVISGTPFGDVPFGGDGLALLDGYVYVVSPSSVSRVRLENDNTAGFVVTRRQVEGIGLSTAAVAEGALYVIKSEVGPFILDRPLELPFEFFRVDLDAFDAETIGSAL